SFLVSTKVSRLCALCVVIVGLGLLGCTGQHNSSPIRLVIARESPSSHVTFQRSEVSSASLGNSLSALWVDPGGKRGWAVGDSVVVLHYAGMRWQRDNTASAASGGNNLWGLWMDPGGKRGWAAGARGLVLRYDGMRWRRDDTASGASGGKTLRAFW